jgi:hypothetical protein
VVAGLVVDGLDRGHVAGDGVVEGDVLRFAVGRRRPDAERRGPERLRVADLVLLDVDEKCGHSAAMHGDNLFS